MYLHSDRVVQVYISDVAATKWMSRLDSSMACKTLQYLIIWMYVRAIFGYDCVQYLAMWLQYFDVCVCNICFLRVCNISICVCDILLFVGDKMKYDALCAINLVICGGIKWSYVCAIVSLFVCNKFYDAWGNKMMLCVRNNLVICVQ